MLSRVADSIFWMARYMERTNGLLRVLRTNYIASQDEVTDLSWQSVLSTYGSLEEEKIHSIEKNSRAVLEYVMFEKENDASLINNITRARENAKAVQDHITKEMWQALNGFYLLIREPQILNQVKHEDPVTALDTLIKQGLFLHGTVDVTMARGEAYNYLNIGRYLERAMISTEVINIKLNELKFNLLQPVEAPAWRYLLYSIAGYEFYTKTYRGNLQADLVFQQILYSVYFPHSVLYCLQQINRYFERLKNESLPESYNRLEFVIGKAMNNLKYSNRQLTDGEALRTLLSHTRNDLFETAHGFNQYYFGNN
ncbi:MAG: alpha-E domain-containing protein [Bacteroidetes bacterium]|nr:alpha-E domain-containing protein [Bacteroidota bacterium]